MSDAPETAEELETLKVPELKKLLSERGLEIPRLKKQMIEVLLKSPSKAQMKEEGAEPVAVSAVAEETAKEVPREEPKQEPEQPAPSEQAPEEPKPVEEPKKEEKTVDAAPMEVIPPPAEPKEETKPEAAASTTATTTTISAPPSATTTTSKPEEEPVKKKRRGWGAPTIQPTAPPITSDTVHRIVTPKVEATAPAAASPAPEANAAKKPEEGETEEKKKRAREEITPAAAPVAPPAPATAPAATDATSGKNPPSNTIYVDRFVRPFTLASAKSLFEQHGAVKRFWMNSIKSHAFVVFESDESAARAREAVNGLKWPSKQGNQLHAEFSSEEIATRVITHEEETAAAATKVTLPRPSAGDLTKPATLPAAPAVPAAAAAPAPPPAPEAPPKEQKKGELQIPFLFFSSPLQREERARPTPLWRLTETKSDHHNNDKTETTLDDLFRKTKAKPHIYFLPLTPAQADAAESQREADRR